MIKTIGCDYNSFQFPCGEHQVVVYNFYTDKVDIEFEWAATTGNAEIFELLLLVDAIKRAGHQIDKLKIPYFPYARQDRVASYGESLAIKVFADVVNSIKARQVVVLDPHSEVTTALINNLSVTPQEEIYYNMLGGRYYRDFYLISSDGGALKKIFKVAQKVNPIGIIECSKHRDVKTGAITETIVHADDLQGKTCVIVDDICDGGRTFIEVAKVLKTKNAGKIVLFTTHGFYTKGLDVFEDIDEIYNRNGQVK